MTELFVGDDPETLEQTVRPIKYRYALANIRTGKIIAMLPMVQVTYTVGMYSGQEMSGTVYLPDLFMDMMPHQPSLEYESWVSPDSRGMPIAEMFECGNRALYILRNNEVVWGGILWTKTYSSGDNTMQTTGISWDGYLYYRLLRKTVWFNRDDKQEEGRTLETNKYKIWYAVIRQTLEDFNWDGNPSAKWSAGKLPGEAQGKNRIDNNDPDELPQYTLVPWTGLTRNVNGKKKSNVPARAYIERWPDNSPDIELPPWNLNWEPLERHGDKVNLEFRGYDMQVVGEALQAWAGTQTLTNGEWFEYRVECWWNVPQQRFRQRYTFGEMEHDPDNYWADATGIISGHIGRNSRAKVETVENKLVFDYPGHISEWSLSESMEECATRVIALGGTDGSNHRIGISSNRVMMKRPEEAETIDGEEYPIGSRGWLLYDKVLAVSDAKAKFSPSTLKQRALAWRRFLKPPEAERIVDIDDVYEKRRHRTSRRSTEFSATLYVDPFTEFPEWHLGDWATFAIDDPLYGGKMYINRRIIAYSVTVLPDMESDYSHEQITLELIDQTHIEPGGEDD